MKKIDLSLLTLSLLTSMQLSAVTIYEDPQTKQLFSEPAEGRVALGSHEKSSEATKSDANGITIINQKSPDFLLGKETHINMKFVPEDAPDMWLKAGVRIQGSFENVNTKYSDSTKDTNINDAYLRRVRFEVAAGFGEHASFVMDVRNDKSNYGIENDEGNFNVGDAYVKIKKPFASSLVNFKLYRAKIDISRTETVKSARVIAYDRPYIADAAAQYISFNRRGANVQVYGDWEKKIHYQIATGSASSPAKVIDASGAKLSGVNSDLSEQSFFYGAKVRFSPFDGWEERKRTETYFGEGKHLSLGASYWAIPKMKGSVTSSGGANIANFDLTRELINIEASGHYKGFFAQAEYFKFDGVVKDWEVNGDVESGSSDGWYATSEYVFTDFYYVAPFVRYESWNRFEDLDGYEINSMLAGVNWYLRGNTTKVGFVYQKDEIGKNVGDKDVTKMRVVSQWFF